MSHAVVDLFSVSFWLTVALAIVALTPLTHGRARQLVFFAVNLGFVAALLKVLVIGPLALVAVVWVFLKLCAGPERGRWTFAALVLGSLGVLMLHKLPSLVPQVGPLTYVNPILVGIGFSYVFLRIIDVARSVHAGRHPPPDPVRLFNYLMPFHMLAAGPIEAYEDHVAQPSVPPRLSPAETLRGVERVAWGLFKKFVIAFAIERLFLTRFMVDDPWYFLLEMHLYAIWFYLDFSAISDIAVGLGKLMGVHTPENFDKPWLARNMINFWERWHITLGEWIRRNLFIPMQLHLARRTRGKRQLLIGSVSLGVAFWLCGLWHGVSWPFFIWGAMHGFGVMIANVYRHLLRKRLGKKGVRAYMQKRWIRVAATVITVEWVAASLVVVGWHWGVP